MIFLEILSRCLSKVELKHFKFINNPDSQALYLRMSSLLKGTFLCYH